VPGLAENSAHRKLVGWLQSGIHIRACFGLICTRRTCVSDTSLPHAEGIHECAFVRALERSPTLRRKERAFNHQDESHGHCRRASKPEVAFAHPLHREELADSALVASPGAALPRAPPAASARIPPSARLSLDHNLGDALHEVVVNRAVRHYRLCRVEVGTLRRPCRARTSVEPVSASSEGVAAALEQSVSIRRPARLQASRSFLPALQV